MTRDLLKNEGIRVFWKGNTAGIGLYASYSAVQFATFNFINRQHCKNSFINGSVSALLATSITYPLDLLRTRMTLSRGSSGGIFDHFIRVFRGSEGPAGLFKGYFLSVGQVVPYMGCVFGLHGYFVKKFQVSDFIAGVASGFISKSIFMPTDVFRRRLQLFQTNPDQFSLSKDALKYTQRSKTKIDLFLMMWRKEGGLKAFYRGWSMAILKSAPVTGITFAVHAFIMDQWQQR